MSAVSKREVVERLINEGKKAKEIAEEAGCSRGYVSAVKAMVDNRGDNTETKTPRAAKPKKSPKPKPASKPKKTWTPVAERKTSTDDRKTVDALRNLVVSQALRIKELEERA